MEENNDFVIDTGMPVPPPVQEAESAPTADVEPTAAATDQTPTLDEPAAEQAPCEAPESVAVPDANTEPEPVAEPAPVVEAEPEEPAKDPQEPTLADVAALVEDLRRKFDEKIAVDEHKNGLFDKLYKERDEYKNDIYAKLLRPFVVGAIGIISDLRMYISKMDTYDVERSLNYLKSVPDDIIELLENNGVELFEDEGEAFNPKTQRAKKTVPTDDPALNNTIAERLEKGYRWNGVVLRPEMVTVYKAQN